MSPTEVESGSNTLKIMSNRQGNLNIAPPEPDEFIDITHEVCPMTFVRTRLALDRLAPGQILSVRLKGEEPLRNVPKTAQRQGHELLAAEPGPDGSTTLFIRKASRPQA